MSIFPYSQYEAELSRRFGAESQFSRSTGHGQFGLIGGLHDHMHGDTFSKDDHHPHIQRLPTQQLIRKVGIIRKHKLNVAVYTQYPLCPNPLSPSLPDPTRCGKFQNLNSALLEA